MEEQPMHEIRTAEPAGYAEFLAELKQRIERAQLRASLAVNRELMPNSAERVTPNNCSTTKWQIDGHR
jgi:hypothetical protein